MNMQATGEQSSRSLRFRPIHLSGPKICRHTSDRAPDLTCQTCTAPYQLSLIYECTEQTCCTGRRNFEFCTFRAATVMTTCDYCDVLIRRVNTPTDQKKCKILFYGGFMLGWV